MKPLVIEFIFFAVLWILLWTLTIRQVSIYCTNETWNTCPICYKKWKDDVPIKGLLHRTRICDNPECIEKINEIRKELEATENGL